MRAANFRLICVLLCCCGGGAYGAFERQTECVRGCAMGGAGAALTGNVWGGLMNPAGLAGIGCRTVAVSTAPSPFGLRELRRSACAYAEPLGRFTASVAALRYGYELYHEVTLGGSCAYDFGGGVRGGVACTLNTLSIAGYGSGSCAGFDAGLLWEIVRGLHVGACVLNANSPPPGASHEGIPRTFVAGIAYAPVSPFTLACDVAEDVRFPAEIRLGAEYLLAGHLFLRAGISSEPSTYTAGLGIRVWSLDIDYAFSRHLELGFTHRFGLSVGIGGS